MSDDPYADRRRLSFEQAEGAEPLPTQLRPKELSRQLRALLWLRVHTSLVSDSDLDFSFMGEQWRTILFDNFVQREHHMADEFVSNESLLIASVKAIFSSGNYLGVFGFLQFVLRHPRCPYGFAQQIDNALKVSRAAYRVLDGNTIVPVASEAERATIERALADLASKEFQGARSHLRTSGSELTNGDYAASVRESVHAVESVARTLAPSGSLADALARLENSTAIHSALKRGFSNIYGYTSDQKGIRHPLLDGPKANVDEADALFMIGACAAFVSYMIHKARLAGLLAQPS